MKTKQLTANEESEEPTVVYIVVEKETNILNNVFDELFERVEKEIK